MLDGPVAISGNIGVGKSSLCVRLAGELGARADLEDVRRNPHFDRFYADPAQWAFSSQLAFTAEAAARHIRAQDGLPVVLDRTIYETTAVFGRALASRDDLSGDHLEVLEKAARAIRLLPRQPLLLIHLTAPIDTLLDRIANRGRPAERDLDAFYLEQLEERYRVFLQSWDLCPIVTIDTVERDLRRTSEMQQLVRTIAETS